MKFHKAIAAGMQHIQENKLRAGLSILGIFIGIASVLCMMAIGDGAKQIIADDIEKIGGANQVQLWTRQSVRRRGRRYPTTERYTLGDAYAIETECPDVTGVLPRNRRHSVFVTSRLGGEFRGADLEGVTADYAELMQFELQAGRFLSENDIDNATQVCVLGANVVEELFGHASPIGQEIKLRNRWRQTPVRMRVVGTMAPKGRNLSVTWGSLDDMICVPITTYQQRITGIRYVERINIFFQKDVDIYDIVKSARKVIRQRHRGIDNFTSYWRPKRSVERLEQIEKMIKIALGGIAGFSLLVSGIGTPYRMQPRGRDTPLDYIEIARPSTDTVSITVHFKAENAAAATEELGASLMRDVRVEHIVNTPTSRISVDIENGGLVLDFDAETRLNRVYYIPPLGWNSLAVELFLRGEHKDIFVPVYPTDSSPAKDIKVWEIRYPADIETDEKYLATEMSLQF